MTGIKALVGLAPLTFAGAAAMTFGAAYVRGLTGFGMAIILVPLLGMIVPPGQAVVVAIILQLLIGPVGLRVILADADRHTAVPIGLIALVAAGTGIAMARRTAAFVVASGCLDVTANLLFAAGSQRGAVSVVAVLGSLYPVTTVMLAATLLHERLGRLQALGAAIALAGVVLIAAG